MVLGWFFMFLGRFLWFPRFQVGFPWSYMILGRVFEVPDWCYGSRSVFMGFRGSRLVFHGSRWVSMVPCLVFMIPGGLLAFNGSRVVFYYFRWIFMVIRGSMFIFMIIYGSRLISWFQVVFLVFRGSRLVFIRADRRRCEVRRWEHPKRYPLDLYFFPTIPLGLAGRRPALA